MLGPYRMHDRDPGHDLGKEGACSVWADVVILRRSEFVRNVFLPEGMV